MPTVYKNRGYVETILSVDTSTVTSNTYVDVTGASLTLSPGVWDIGFDASIAQTWTTNGPVGTVEITDNANNLIGNAIRHINTALSVVGTESKPITLIAREVIVSTSTTYKVRIRCTQSAAAAVVTVQALANQAGALTDPDTKAVFWARKSA